MTTHQTQRMARRLARQCRRVIQCCLREEEWRDVDEEFTVIIAAALTDWIAAHCGDGGEAAESLGLDDLRVD